MARKHLTIGIFGFGCVGQGLYEALTRSGSVPATIKKICIKHADKERSLPAELFTTNPNEILNDPDIDVVLELIDDAEAAYGIVTNALKQGKAVVSANKKLLALHFEELQTLQKETGSAFLYEGACCASIPIIRNLEEYYDNDLLQGISGIFNGSSNYILSRIFSQGWDYVTALKQAQILGFAESDPTLDVEGFDPAYKLSILSAHAFGCRISPERILRRGITGIGGQELRFAREKGYQLKLVARAERIGEKLFASVLPTFVSIDDPLFSVEDEYHAVLVAGAFSDVQFFKGKGAGSLPTGSAVLSDLSALGYDYQYEYRKGKDRELRTGTSKSLRIYLRFQDPEVLTGIEFETIEESYRSLDHCYVTGQVDSAILQKFLLSSAGKASFVAELPCKVDTPREKEVEEIILNASLAKIGAQIPETISL